MAVDIYRLNGLKQRRCKSNCGAKFYNSLIKDDVRYKPCKNWCEAQKPEVENPPSHSFFNNELGINPNPENAPVFKKDLKQLQSLSNEGVTVKKAQQTTQDNGIIVPTGGIKNTTVPNSEIIIPPVIKEEEKDEKNLKPYIIGGSLGLLALIGIGVAVSRN